MSDYQRINGSLQLVSITEEEAEKLCCERDIDKYGDSWIETLGVESDDYCYLKKVGLFKILEFNEEDPYASWMKVKREGDIYHFDTYYHNGGCHWTELFDDWLEKQ